MAWPPVLSQRTYPGAGDVDDCWVVATVWAATASRPGIRRPTVTEFRRHAGDPDDGIRDGGSLDEVMRGAEGSWPSLDVDRWQTTHWDSFAALVKAERPASLAVDSATLPSAIRWGFYGKHQIGVVWLGRFLVMNPLAPPGSALQPITESALKAAALALLPALREVRAAVFPAPIDLPDTDTGDDMASYAVPGRWQARFKAGADAFDKPLGARVGDVESGKFYDLTGQDKQDDPDWYELDGGSAGLKRWARDSDIAEKRDLIATVIKDDRAKARIVYS